MVTYELMRHIYFFVYVEDVSVLPALSGAHKYILN